jgi:hypothetical protein
MLGTSPEFNKLFISSKNDSLTIYVSVNKKVHSLPSTPVKSFKVLINSLKLWIPYPFTISIFLFWQLRMKLHNFVKDYFPDPPTPINIEFPLGCLSTLEILRTCSMASSKKMSFC